MYLTDLTLSGEKWTFGIGEEGPLEWFDAANPGAPGNFLQRGANPVALDKVHLVVLVGGSAVINTPMVADGDRWKLESGDPGHVVLGNGVQATAVASAVLGQVEIAKATKLFNT